MNHTTQEKKCCDHHVDRMTEWPCRCKCHTTQEEEVKELKKLSFWNALLESEKATLIFLIRTTRQQAVAEKMEEVRKAVESMKKGKAHPRMTGRPQDLNDEWDAALNGILSLLTTKEKSV